MKERLSKTSALARAQRAVGCVFNTTTDARWHEPATHDLDGLVCECAAPTYRDAVRCRRDSVASIALQLMGWALLDAECAIWRFSDRYETTSARGMVNAVLEEQMRPGRGLHA